MTIFLIWTLLNILITMTGIKFWKISNARQIRLITLELFAFECRKKFIFDLVQDIDLFIFIILLKLTDNFLSYGDPWPSG